MATRFLALVGDAADGYPGIPGIGRVTAARLLNRYGILESFPAEVLREHRDLALQFKDLATLRTDEPLFRDAGELRWRRKRGRDRKGHPDGWPPLGSSREYRLRDEEIRFRRSW